MEQGTENMIKTKKKNKDFKEALTGMLRITFEFNSRKILPSGENRVLRNVLKLAIRKAWEMIL